jgi:hypothetical protein
MTKLDDKSLDRRRVLKLAAMGTGVLAAARMPAILAQDDRVDPSSDQAKSLNYVHDAADAADHERYKEGSHCANCQLWQGGDAEWGSCGIFPGKKVSASGWCTAWVAAS